MIHANDHVIENTEVKPDITQNDYSYNMKRRTGVSKLDELCPNHGFEFKTKDFNKMCQPIVYLFIGKHDQPLYVGIGRNGIGRPTAPDHHAKEARKSSASVLVYPCDSVLKAEALERFLIRNLRPVYNIVNNPNKKKYRSGQALVNEHNRIAHDLL